MAFTHVARVLIEAMSKHLPPSAANLRLLDIDSAAGAILAEARADLDVLALSTDPATWMVAPNSIDAVVAYEVVLDDRFLRSALDALRPGGRLIVMHTSGEVSHAPVKILEAAGYTRILVEVGVEYPQPTGVLIRGEKPHTTADTLSRVQAVADHDADMLDLTDFKGRYVHALVVQTPNKPVWAMAEGERYRWQAITVDGRLLGFSSLPKAVHFMQQAVMRGQINGVNKVAKFSKATAATWGQPVLLNPSLDALDPQAVTLTDIDPDSAEASDE